MGDFDVFNYVGGSAGLLAFFTFLIKSWLDRRNQKEQTEAGIATIGIQTKGQFQESLVRDNADLRKDLMQRLQWLEEQMKLARQELDQWQERAFRSEAENEILKAQVQMIQQRFEDLQARYEQVRQEAEAANSENAALRIEINRLIGELTALKNQLGEE